ncbi:MAG: Sec-independent protein translocase protein TatB [Alphaproteobacteria bacterium]
MFDIGWSELAIIAVVALIVIGPRELPRVLYTAGKMAGKARAMLRELQQGIEDIGREAELEDLRKKVDAVRDFDVKTQIRNTIDPKREIEAAFDTEAGLRPERRTGEPADDLPPPPDLPEPKFPARPADTSDPARLPPADPAGAADTPPPRQG